MLDLFYQLKTLGEEIWDRLAVAFFLSSLPDNYTSLVTSLEGQKEEDLTLEVVKDKLLQ